MSSAFGRTGSGDFPLQLKVMISGPPKSGKTTLLGTVPNIVIADTEPHANNLMSLAHLNVPYKTINSSIDLRDLRMILGTEALRKQQAQALGMPDIEAVAIDTLDTFQGILKRERMSETHSTSFTRDDWGWLKTEMENIIQSYLSLPLHVFLIVHTKTKDIGTEKNPKTIILPGLEGGISESIAGMVGYSLLSFRKQEIDPGTGQPYTKYWLRAEGDETYEFVGNRGAGALPNVIEPDFGSLLGAAKQAIANAQAHQSQVVEQIQMQPQGQIQMTGQTVQPQEVAPSPGQAQQAVQQVPAQQAAPKPADDEPITAAALQHIQKMYATVGAQFDQALFQGKTVGEARELVQVYQALVQDFTEGKTTQSPQEAMVAHLQNMGLIGQAAPAPVKTVEPKADGSIDEVMAFIEQSGNDLDVIQQIYNAETAESGKNRSSLVNKLVALGAKVPTDVQSPQEQSATPETAVTPTAAPADESSAEEAEKVIEAALGPTEVISHEINPEALCEVCGNKIDDTDLAKLGQQRFGKILCVSDYLAEGKK